MSSHPTWNEVRGRLRTQDATRHAADREGFWADFRARARMVRQDGAGAPAPVHPWRWVVTGTAVAAALVVAAVGVVALPGRPVAAATSGIKSFEVIAPHSGVIIMNDDSGRGTILWVTGLGDSRSG